jgi:hypothetical protein
MPVISAFGIRVLLAIVASRVALDCDKETPAAERL